MYWTIGIAIALLFVLYYFRDTLLGREERKTVDRQTEPVKQSKVDSYANIKKDAQKRFDEIKKGEIRDDEDVRPFNYDNIDHVPLGGFADREMPDSESAREKKMEELEEIFALFSKNVKRYNDGSSQDERSYEQMKLLANKRLMQKGFLVNDIPEDEVGIDDEIVDKLLNASYSYGVDTLICNAVSFDKKGRLRIPLGSLDSITGKFAPIVQPDGCLMIQLTEQIPRLLDMSYEVGYPIAIRENGFGSARLMTEKEVLGYIKDTKDMQGMVGAREAKETIEMLQSKISMADDARQRDNQLIKRQQSTIEALEEEKKALASKLEAAENKSTSTLAANKEQERLEFEQNLQEVLGANDDIKVPATDLEVPVSSKKELPQTEMKCIYEPVISDDNVTTTTKSSRPIVKAEIVDAIRSELTDTMSTKDLYEKFGLVYWNVGSTGERTGLFDARVLLPFANRLAKSLMLDDFVSKESVEFFIVDKDKKNVAGKFNAVELMINDPFPVGSCKVKMPNTAATIKTMSENSKFSEIALAVLSQIAKGQAPSISSQMFDDPNSPIMKGTV